MESIEKLANAAKECLSDLKTVESRISILDGKLSFLQSQKVALSAEIADMEARKTAILQETSRIEAESKQTVDGRIAAAKAKEAQVLEDAAMLKTKLFQADSAKADAESEKEKYASLYAEYLIKVQELDDKKQAVLQALK